MEDVSNFQPFDWELATLLYNNSLGRSLNYSGSLEIVRMWQS